MSGPQAFPMYFHGSKSPQQGMTLRDYFAAKAMSGFCANDAMIDSNDSRAIAYVADAAYAMADAMLAARELKL